MKSDMIKVLVDRRVVPASIVASLEGAPAEVLEALTVNSEPPKTLEDALARIPEALRSDVTEGLALLTAKRTADATARATLTATIKANASNKLTDAQLGKLDVDVLGAYAQSLGVKVNFAGAQPEQPDSLKGNKDDAIPAAPTIESFLK